MNVLLPPISRSITSLEEYRPKHKNNKKLKEYFKKQTVNIHITFTVPGQDVFKVLRSWYNRSVIPHWVNILKADID